MTTFSAVRTQIKDLTRLRTVHCDLLEALLTASASLGQLSPEVVGVEGATNMVLAAIDAVNDLLEELTQEDNALYKRLSECTTL